MDGWYPRLAWRQFSDHLIQRLSIDPIAKSKLGNVQFDADDSGRGGSEGLGDHSCFVNFFNWLLLIESIFTFRGHSDLYIIILSNLLKRRARVNHHTMNGTELTSVSASSNTR